MKDDPMKKAKRLFIGQSAAKTASQPKLVNLVMVKSKKAAPGTGQSEEKLPAKNSPADEFKVVKKNKEDKKKAAPTSSEDLQDDDRELGGEG